MKKLIYLIVIPLLMVGMGCSDEDGKDTIIPTADYVLGENYSWKDLEREKIYRVDSEEELLNLVEGEGEIAKIDFEKNTLIVVGGLNSSTIDLMEQEFTRDNTEKYLLSLKIISGLGTAMTPWYVAIQTPKIGGNKNIRLIIKK